MVYTFEKLHTGNLSHPLVLLEFGLPPEFALLLEFRLPMDFELPPDFTVLQVFLVICKFTANSNFSIIVCLMNETVSSLCL